MTPIRGILNSEVNKEVSMNRLAKMEELLKQTQSTNLKERIVAKILISVYRSVG